MPRLKHAIRWSYPRCGQLDSRNLDTGRLPVFGNVDTYQAQFGTDHRTTMRCRTEMQTIEVDYRRASPGQTGLAATSIYAAAVTTSWSQFG